MVVLSKGLKQRVAKQYKEGKLYICHNELGPLTKKGKLGATKFIYVKKNDVVMCLGHKKNSLVIEFFHPEGKFIFTIGSHLFTTFDSWFKPVEEVIKK